jgi:hypothetical protein
MTRYPIRVGDRSRLFLRVAFGVTPERAFVDLDADTILVRFGRFELSAPVATATGWRIEGPWAWITAIGVRRSLRRGDISFAGSPRGGVRVDFQPPVRWRFLLPPAIYYGVDDLEGFAAALTALGIPGTDARNGR